MASPVPDIFTIIAQTSQSTIEKCIWNGITAVLKTCRKPHDSRTIHRWKNEVEALKVAGIHDNIAALLSSSSPDLTILLRFESGQSLDHYLNAENHCSLHPNNGTTILRQQASALSHLHSLQLIHDDVKPENIIWDPVVEHAVLIDFGAALNLAVLPAGFFNPSGTPSYAPPEFLCRKKGPEGDVWALGVVMLFVWGYVQLPNGKWLLPGVWDEGGDVEMRRWLGEVSELKGRISDIWPVLGKMLNEVPGKRISSAELIRSLTPLEES